MDLGGDLGEADVFHQREDFENVSLLELHESNDYSSLGGNKTYLVSTEGRFNCNV